MVETAQWLSVHSLSKANQPVSCCACLAPVSIILSIIYADQQSTHAGCVPLNPRSPASGCNSAYRSLIVTPSVGRQAHVTHKEAVCVRLQQGAYRAFGGAVAFSGASTLQQLRVDGGNYSLNTATCTGSSFCQQVGRPET